MKLFFIHEVSYQDKVIYEMHEYPEILASRLHKVFFYDFPEKSSGRWKRLRGSSSVISGRVHKDSNLVLISPTTFYKGILQRLLVIPYSLFDLYNRIRQIKPDVIVTYAVPTYGLQILLIGKFLKIPIMYRAIDVSHLIRDSKFRIILNFIEKVIIQRSNFVSCNSLAMQKYIISRGAKIENVAVNYPPIDLRYFKNSKKLSCVNLKNLFFLGTLFPFCGLQNFILTAHRDGLFNEGYTLTIIGSGEQYDLLKNLIVKLGLCESVNLEGMIHYSKLSGYLENAGITLNPFEKTTLTDIALPHKVIQYAASERPIISSPLEGLLGLFDKEETIFWANTPEEMVKMIRGINEMSLFELQDRVDRQSDHLAAKLNIKEVISSFETTLLKVKKRAG